MLLPLAMILFALFASHNKGQLLPGPKSVQNALPFFWLILPLTIAGAGINTEAPFRVLKGLNGSTGFTLSLPVSRSRLFATRVVFGFSATAGMIVTACCVAWLAFPEVRASVSPNDGLRYLAAVLVCSFAGLGLSTLFASFLDQQIQTIASMGCIFLLLWLFGHTHVPDRFNVSTRSATDRRSSRTCSHGPRPS